MQGMNKRIQGARFEKLAQDYLKQQGYRIICGNFRCQGAEIDLIAREGKYLVFVEVKERSGNTMGQGCEAVDRRKRERICRGARFYLSSRHIDSMMPVRFDVVSIDGGRIRLIRNAFPYQGR